MAHVNITVLLARYFANGGRVTKCPPKPATVKRWYGAHGAYYCHKAVKPSNRAGYYAKCGG